MLRTTLLAQIKNLCAVLSPPSVAANRHSPPYTNVGIVLVSALLFLLSPSARAEVSLAEVFSSGMVLQREMPVPVWGTAAAEEKTVTFEGQTKSTEADADGRWMVELDALKPGGPFSMVVKGQNEIRLDDVLVGDVWLCSGQSNMEWVMNSFPDAKADIPKANHPQIRLLQVPRVWTQRPQTTLGATWKPCNPENVAKFSAVGYYFGVRLQSELHVPIGLINSSWGGIRIEPFTPPVGFDAVLALSEISQRIAAKDPKSHLHKELLGKVIVEYTTWLEETKRHLLESEHFSMPPVFPPQLQSYANNQQETVLYNAMIHPLVPLAMKGVIWYQGESNRGEGMLYAEKMKALILGWRKIFQNDDLPFYYVQLAPFDYGNNPQALPEIWEAQAAVETMLPHTGMVVINDIGDLKNIHPGHKDVVGVRLANLALNRTYGKKELAVDSPALDKMAIENNSIVLTLKNAKELKTRDGQPPNWFEIAGVDGVYHKAEAKIEDRNIRLTSDNVARPCAVRFAWDQQAEPNLQNEAGLPLGAFRAGEIPERGLLDSFVPEAKNFKLVYSFDPTNPTLADNRRRFVYRTDKSGEIIGKIKRVGYFLYLKPKQGEEQFVFVTMPPIQADVKKLGVPAAETGVKYQQPVKDITVTGNVEGLATGTFAEGCYVEFWGTNYGPQNAQGIPGGSADAFDFDDETAPGGAPGYGSMQIHNVAKKQTIFAFNNFGAGKTCDIGIGNCSTGKNPDWTFSQSAKNYDGGQFLVLVELE